MDLEGELFTLRDTETPGPLLGVIRRGGLNQDTATAVAITWSDLPETGILVIKALHGYTTAGAGQTRTQVTCTVTDTRGIWMYGADVEASAAAGKLGFKFDHPMVVDLEPDAYITTTAAFDAGTNTNRLDAYLEARWYPQGNVEWR